MLSLPVYIKEFDDKNKIRYVYNIYSVLLGLVLGIPTLLGWLMGPSRLPGEGNLLAFYCTSHQTNTVRFWKKVLTFMTEKDKQHSKH